MGGACVKTCEICGWTWDPNPWTKCPRCVARTRAYEPTPEEISAACKEIRKTWSPRMRHQRQAEAYRNDHVETAVLHDPHSDALGIQ